MNKVNSRVSLQFSVATSACLSESQKSRIFHRLKTRINKDGVLQLHAQTARSQALNRETLIDRFAKLIREALIVPKPRKRLALPRRVTEKRLEHKKHRGDLKKNRTSPRNFEN